ncbi:hypothetical protein [Sporosarcina sp. Te-1]|uniref:hypothetical protein n=1 Tax=Sporosarcina sp. Te-1 TaxID=2818390 RepID=UPI001A9E2CCF|nr:hypothetical protein [Sporosarcina sp. Te-1]QTD40818.1 hypothetical protein J3U78_19055 [Sporosarcina sp. Te-1]
MLKKAKGKVIAGTLVVGLVAGGGAVLGATDAGANLKAWYDAQFGKANEKITTEVANYGNSKIDGLLTEYNGLKADATSRIDSKGEFVGDVTKDGIQKRSEEHIDAIKEQKAHIESYLGSQFDSLAQFANGLIEQSGKDALAYAESDLKQHAGDAGKVAGEKMEADIKAATADAIKDLEDTIRWAKEDLQAKLDKETDLTIEEIKAMIDAKIVELRGKVTALNNTFVKEQERVITMAGKALLLDAERQLDALVNGINK